MPQKSFCDCCSSGHPGMSSTSSALGMAAICMSEESAMALAAVLTLTGPSTIPSNASAKVSRLSTTMAIMAHKLA
ncbi:hypothetical protein C770_GR4pA153 (plasmid) [Sinorhizobium meliloti GR4]|nr:hypothetical protein C770_GR4pA153 [Sinorhizobium meliloti GR4]ASQ06069.1 hypothetical protein CDO23_18305 [Sinorhizobium meliloti]